MQKFKIKSLRYITLKTHFKISKSDLPFFPHFPFFSRFSSFLAYSLVCIQIFSLIGSRKNSSEKKITENQYNIKKREKPMKMSGILVFLDNISSCWQYIFFRCSDKYKNRLWSGRRFYFVVSFTVFFAFLFCLFRFQSCTLTHTQ